MPDSGALRSRAGGGDVDSRRKGDGDVLVMVRALGSRGWGDMGVGVGGARVRGSDGAATAEERVTAALQ
jgi:hypothetical protein